ncbi:hypothetical protein [Rhodoferax sp.]|uniref:hypothetical protein n=1 Tax=Rhodoferax sp. TaxID=50421 RepID=UPI0027268F0F|nr:hypothetical protein [Rhodoferax sp.]MDO9195067.1 hypothetical protein [Rhodoferax sp.]
MQIRTSVAIVLIATIALSTGAMAQNIYKCGDTYSQTPCPGGAIVDAADQRTPGQKTQADLATRRDARAADALEKARLKQEKAAIAANAPTVKPEVASTATDTSTAYAKKKKKKTPEHFTAQIPGKKKQKQSAKKRPEKKDELKS